MGRTRPALARPAFSRRLLENDRLRAKRQCQRLNVRYFPNSETTPNCTLFDSLRKWAYVAVRQYRGDKITLWREAVATQALKLNQFAMPLDAKEAQGIGKSVASGYGRVMQRPKQSLLLSRQLKAAKVARATVQPCKQRKAEKVVKPTD